MGEETDLGERLWPHQGTDCDRIGRIEDLTRLEGWQERVDLLLGRDVDALGRVGEHEPVHVHHDGQRQVLGEAERLDVQVGGFLVGLGEEHHPPRVPYGHRVAVVVPDVDGCPDRPVGKGHHDRKAEAAGVVDRLDHEQQALAGSRRVGPRSGRRGTDRHRHRSELRLDIDELAAGELAGLDHLSYALDDVGLRGDRIGAHDLGTAGRHGHGDGSGTLKLA